MGNCRAEPAASGGSLSLSVVMANYNDAALITGALEAILGQSVRPVQVTVVDDASTDNSVEVIEGIARRDPAVRLLRNERNLGPIVSGNRACAVTTGDCVYFAAADDRILPGFFEKSLAMLARHPEAGLCFSLRELIDEDGHVIPGHVPWGPGTTSCYVPPAEVTRILLRRGLFILGTNTIYRRGALWTHLPWRVQLRGFIDGFVAHSMALEGGVCFVPEVLVQKRLMPRRFSASGQYDPDHVLGGADYAIRLMETEYGHLWPTAFVDQYSRMTTRGLGRLIALLLRSNNESVMETLRDLGTRRPCAFSGIFLRALESWMRITEWTFHAYVKIAYRPNLRRLLDKAGEAVTGRQMP